MFHILEEDIKAQIDPAVWDDQFALLEVALDIDDIRASMASVRERIDVPVRRDLRELAGDTPHPLESLSEGPC